MSVLSVGSLNADFIATAEVDVPGPGTYTGRELLRTSGGKAANVAVLARRLGVPATLVAVVGDDDLAAQALAGPEAAGVDLAGVVVSSGPTSSALIVVPPSGDKTIVRVAATDHRWDAAAASSALGAVQRTPAGTVVVIDLEMSSDVALDVARAAHDRGLVVVLDPAPPELASEEFVAVAGHLTPDHREATVMTGVDATTVDGATEAARSLHHRSGGTGYVKLAKGGCAVSGPDGEFVVPPPGGLDAVDATGAGDAFAGGLAVALARGDDIRSATETAVAAASCAVTTLGSQESYPEPDELERMLARVRRRNR